MGETDHDRLLRSAWEGEVLGRSAFTALHDVLPDDASLWRRLALLETTMESMCERVGRAHGLTIDAATLEAAGAGSGAGTGPAQRDDTIRMVLGVAARALLGYRSLAGLLSAEDAWLGDELVAHEQALVADLEAALAGEAGGERLTLEFLERHGVEAGSRA